MARVIGSPRLDLARASRALRKTLLKAFFDSKDASILDGIQLGIVIKE
jgi:hypothetical protein